MPDKTMRCPSAKELQAFVGDPLQAGNEDLAGHVYVCEDCRKRVEELLYAGAGELLTDVEKKTIRSFADAHCAPMRTLDERLDEFVRARQSDFFAEGLSDWRMAAASGQMATREDRPVEDVRFVFVSEEQSAREDLWRAELEIPGTAGGSDPLGISIRGRDGGLVGEGLFSIAGTTLPVEGGKAEIPLDMFLLGIRNSTVSFQREGGVPVVGNLAFF